MPLEGPEVLGHLADRGEDGVPEVEGDPKAGEVG